MQEQANKMRGQRGFTLIELAIVLAVLGIMMGGLFQLTAATSRTIQDQVTAQQFQQYIRATRAYLAARTTVNGAVNPATVTIGNNPADMPLINFAIGDVIDITARVQAFRTGLATQTPLTSTYGVRVRRLADVVTASGREPMFAMAVVAIGGNAYTRGQIGSIATLIGAEGASVLNGATTGEVDNGATACNEAGITVRSAFGAVCINVADLQGALPALTAERPAVLAYATPSDLSSSLSQWLSRTEVPGAPQMTTMSADLRMGGPNAVPAADPGNDIIMLDAQNDIFLAGGRISHVTAGQPVNIGTTLNMISPFGITLNNGTISDATNTFVQVADSLRIATNQSLEINGSIVGHSGGGLQGITFYNSATAQTFPMNVGIGVLGDQSTITLGSIATATGLRVEGSLSARSFIYTSSDRALKYDIKPIATALDKVMKINGVSYRLKSNDQKAIGVVAQEVEAVLPDLVADDPHGLKMVNYDGLTGVLIQAIHELVNENKELRKRVEKLERAAGHH